MYVERRYCVVGISINLQVKMSTDKYLQSIQIEKITTPAGQLVPTESL